jgi:hypothetical protein
MLDLSWKVDRRVCFKALLKNYSVIEKSTRFLVPMLEIICVVRKVNNLLPAEVHWHTIQS